MRINRCSSEVQVLCPAKLNLHFEVLAHRDDGFHEVDILMVPVASFDALRLSTASNGRIAVRCCWAEGLRGMERGASCGATQGSCYGELPQGESNIVWRALRLLSDRAGAGGFGAEVQLVKRIPTAAGLGGGSSDAAAALAAANLAWELGWPQDELAGLAAEIGSDVPFFLASGAALCRGRGELIIPFDLPCVMHFVVVCPPVGLSTAEVYRRCRPADRPVTAERITLALRNGDITTAASCMHNRLQAPAEQMSPWIGRLREEMRRVGCLGHQMSGSGSSYFGVFRSARHARRVAGALRSRGLGTVFRTSSEVNRRTS